MPDKTCKICGKFNAGAAKFCGGCGSRFPKEQADKLVESDFSALFKVAESQPATEESDLFQIQVKESSNERPPEKDVHLGAEELEKLFESGGDEGEKELENLFGDISAPSPQKAPTTDNGEAGLDEAFNKLLEQREAEEQTVSPLDLSSPTAALLKDDDVLAEARRELATDGIPTTSGDDMAALLEEAQQVAAKDEEEEPAPPEPAPPSEVEEVSEESSEAEEEERPRSRRPRRQPARGRRLASSMARAELLPPVTFIGRVASLLTFVCLSTACGLGAVSVLAPTTAKHYVAAVPLVGLLIAYITKRVIKAETMPLPIFNVLLLAITFLSTFEVAGKTLAGWQIFEIKAERLKPFVMAIIVVAGLHQVMRSRLLHRTFRYILATVGIYSLTGLIAGITGKLSYTEIIIKRQLDVAKSGELLNQLVTAFEPTFVAVNFFLPLVIIVLAFEAMRLLMNKIWGHALGLFLTAAFFALVLFGNVLLYEKANVPNIKSMIRGLQTGRPILKMPEKAAPLN